MNLLRTATLFALVFTMTSGITLAEPPRVLVSVKPVHSLIAQVMHGIGEPDLLLTGNLSPHTYAMRPSDSRKLHEADVVFWVGPSLETFLVKALSTIKSDTQLIALTQQAGINLVRTRSSHLHGHNDETQNVTELEVDPHIWLDPNNAKAIVNITVSALSEIDHKNEHIYRKNGDEAIARLTALDNELRDFLKPILEKPYVVFHDAYQHFEIHYGLNSIAAVTVDAGKTPGAKGIVELRKLIVENNVKCIFAEPQFEPKIIKSITEGSDIKIGTLDSLGATIEPGVNAYGKMMLGIADSLVSCLGDVQ